MKIIAQSGSEKPLMFVKIDDLARHVQTTLGRCPTPLPGSLTRQLSGLISHCLRQQLVGKESYPGLAKMGKMGRCCDRQARRNIRQLEVWNVMHVVAFAKGGRWATRYWMDVAAIKRVLMALECNPSPALLEKISDIMVELRADIWADIWADICPDTMSAGIQYRIGQHKKNPAKGENHE